MSIHYFLNYDVTTGLSIDTFRRPGSSYGTIGDVVEAYEAQNECVCCDLDGAADALCDGEYLKSVNASQESVEAVYDFLFLTDDY